MFNTTLLIDCNAVAHTIDVNTCKDNKTFARAFFSRILEYTKAVSTIPKIILFFDDKAGGTWRDSIYSDYQKNRKLQREHYTEIQIEEAKKRREGISYLQKQIDNSKYDYVHYPHTEADDLISLYCNNIQQDNETIIILTTDKDLFQLVREKTKKVKVLFLIKRKLVTKESEGKEILKQKIYLGDPSDSIPGVCKNVGKTTFPDFEIFLNKMEETKTDPTDQTEAKRICENANIRYIPSFSNFSLEQLDINKKLVDLSYVVELDKKDNNIKTNYLKDMMKTAKLNSPFVLQTIKLV